MNCGEIARRFSKSRPGFKIVSFGEVGLPVHRISLRAQVLERKPVPPMEEIVMLAADAGLCERETIRGLLGLERPLFEGVLAELLRKEHIALGSGEDGMSLELTPAGREVLGVAREIASADMPLDVHFDSLLRTVVPYIAGLIDARQMDLVGLSEVPPARPRPPELSDLDVEAVQRAVLEIPRVDAVRADLLALKRIDRRTRTFRPATILVYRSEERKEVQVTFVVDGEISEPHQSAFAKARLTTKMRVRAAAMEEPAELFATFFGREPEEAPADADKAPAHRDLEVLDCFDLPGRLQNAIDSPCKRLLIASPRLTQQIVNADFLDSLRHRLVEGAEVFIGLGSESQNPNGRELERTPWRRLSELFERYPNLRLQRFSRPGPGILAVDREEAILTRLSLLGHEGDPDRNYVDERGARISSTVLIDQLFANEIPRFD
jgi:hypothetical protein